MGNLLSYRGPCDCMPNRKILPGSDNHDVIIVDNGHIRTEISTTNFRHTSHPSIVNANEHLPIAPSAYLNNASVGSSIFQKFTKDTCPICLLIIGLDDSGKTSLLRTVEHRYPSMISKKNRNYGDNLEDPKPTLGFSRETIQFRKHEVLLHDLGGRKTIRGIWKNYLAEAHGMILVLDSSLHIASPKWDELNEVLEKLSENNYLSLQGKPTVILSNKQDVRPNITEVELLARVDMKEFLDKYNLPYKVYPVCTREKELIRSAKFKRLVCTKNIDSALCWIIQRVEDAYPSLHMKVQLDTRAQVEHEEEERQERAARFKAAREAEQQEDEDDEEGSGKSDMPSPFVPIEEHLRKHEKDLPSTFNDVQTTKRVETPSAQIRTISVLSMSKSEPSLHATADDGGSDILIDESVQGDFRREDQWSSVINLRALDPLETKSSLENGDIIVSDTEDPAELRNSRPSMRKRIEQPYFRRLSLQNGSLL